MKRIVSLVLALSMVLSMFATAFAGTTFKDVDNTEFESAVSALVELGIVNGYDDGTYKPETVVTRAQMAKLLVEASGLKDAAELNLGATKFSDVDYAGAHKWATGYINVASEYGFINGYPDGSFAPNAPVKYSEAVTMVIRALGYGARVETKGTWPTNYIQFAKELKVLDEVKYDSYNNGAIRGNVAKLVWNMLRTYMWDITGENESTGFNSSAEGKVTMLDKYFEDYTYATVLVESVDITDKGEVMVSLNDTDASLEKVNTLKYEKYLYLGNDFYTFVPNTEVEVLVNEEKDGTLLTIVPTGENELVAGTIAELKDAKYTSVPASGDYVYAIVNDSDALTSTTIVNIESNTYVEEVEVKDSYIKVNGSRLRNSENSDDALFEKEIVIKDGERVSMKNVKAGEVITKASVSGDIFYVIGSAEESGKLTKYVVENNVGTITVAGEEYTLDTNAKYVIDPEDEDENAKTFKTSSEFEDMKNEVVTLVCDALLGKVVRIEFDGNIDDDDDTTTGKFFAITKAISKEGLGNYVIGLEDEKGSDSYVFAEDCTTGKTWFTNDVNNVGRYVFAKLNDEKEIEEITEVVYVSGDSYAYVSGEFAYGEKSGETYTVEYIASATYDEDDKVITTVPGFASGLDVTEDVVVVTIVTDDNKKKNDVSDDKYSITFAEGLEAIEDLDGEQAVVIYDNDAIFKEAKYVVLFDELANKSDVKVDIVATLKNGLKAFAQNKLGDWELKLEGETVVLESGDVDYNEYKVVAYETEDIEDNDLDEMIFVAGLTSGELSLSGDLAHGYVEEVKGDKVKVDGNQFTLSNKTTVDTYEECVFVLVTVVESDDFLTSGMYDADSVEVVEYEDLTFEKADRISGEPTDAVVFIIRGMEERPEA